MVRPQSSYILTLMLLVANSPNAKWCKTNWKINENMANGYSSESTQRELSNEYQHDRVQIFFKNLCDLVLWMNVVLALEGLTNGLFKVITILLELHSPLTNSSGSSTEAWRAELLLEWSTRRLVYLGNTNLTQITLLQLISVKSCWLLYCSFYLTSTF